MKKTLSTLLLFASAMLVAFGASYTGKVFIDSNNNGVYDKGEKLLRNVAVSDGLHVVLTDKNGEFTLPGHDKERFIFITTPSGYKTNHAYYQKIETDNQSYDFGVSPLKGRINSKGEHSFIQITDTEIFNTTDHEDWISNIRKYANDEEVAFIMHTGDICYDNGLREHIKLMNTENMETPVFYGIGNHDLVKGEYGEKLFEDIYGPVFYSFDVGNVHYVVTPMLSGDYRPSYTKEDVYKWLKNDLALVPKGKPVIVFSHDLLTYSDKFHYGINDEEFVNLNEHNLKAWIYGHWHINYMRKQGDVYTICSSTPDKGGIDHSTANFRVIDVDRNGDIQSDLRYPYNEAIIQINSIANSKAVLAPSEKIALSVNTYNSDSPTKEVAYTCLVDGKQIGKGKLNQQTDWNWSHELALSPKYMGKTIEILALAIFNNGETVETTESFVYSAEPSSKITTTEDWSKLLQNAQHVPTLSDTLKAPLSLTWINNVNANIYMTSPIVYQGSVYTASVDENLRGEAHIYAFDAKTGVLNWKYKVRNSIKNSIAAESGHVFAQDVEGHLYAVHATTGQLVWEKKLPVNGLPALIEGLTAEDGIVYAGTGLGLTACDAITGETLWTNSDWRQGEGTTTTLALSKNHVISGSQWSALRANDKSTGKLIWSNGNNGLSDRGASVAVHNNLLYVISRKSLFIMDNETGRVIVRKELPVSVDATSTPLLTKNLIIFGTAESGLIALDKETLEMKWQFETGEALIYTSPYTRSPFQTVETSPVQSGDLIYVTASDGKLYAIELATGKSVWEFATGAPIFGSVALSGNGLFIIDFAGNIYGFASE